MSSPATDSFDERALRVFYAALQADAGVQVSWFLAELRRLYNLPRSKKDIQAHRMADGCWKKLVDEVLPVRRLLEAKSQTSGLIRFNLSNDFPDCYLKEDQDKDWRGIEVTGSLRRERNYAMLELNEKGCGRGFVGLGDNESSLKFKEAFAKPREMYSTKDALEAIKEAILLAFEKKRNKDTSNMVCDLLIVGPYDALPSERYQIILPDLREAVLNGPYEGVYLIGYDPSPSFFQIK